MEKINEYIEKKERLPMVALRGLFIFPSMVMRFDIGREKSIASLNQALIGDQRIFLAVQKEEEIEEPSPSQIASMGVIAEVKQTIKLPNGNIRVLVEGINRARIERYESFDDALVVDLISYEYVAEDQKDQIELKAMERLLTNEFTEYSKYMPDLTPDFLYSMKENKNYDVIVDEMASYLIMDMNKSQQLIETLDVYQRMILLHSFLVEENKILAIEKEINDKVKTKINKSQKEYYLKEQLQTIKRELGEDDGDFDSEIEEYIDKIKKLDMDEKSKEHVLKEANRVKYMQQGSPEINVVKTYLDYVLDIPWGKYSEGLIDISKARKILDKNHYGLKDVKERILEFISVKKLKADMKGSILCLVGPPGVGKTSIVKGIAEAVNRNYVSMRLGGLTDESEIRGHRKTYIGAMPGRIVTSFITAGTMNPVFLFDEIDKISSSYRADPSSAMLEVLDPNQNNEFMDRYIEIPMDLSQTLFVTTANDASTIPQALLDRMEVIRISGYTSEEKFYIAKKHLVKKQIEEHGLVSSQLNISDSVIRKIINNYTREAGVRNLERFIAKICRKAAIRIVENNMDTVKVTIKNYKDFIGEELVLDDEIIRDPEIGVVTGLAWTEVGGELLQIEVNSMKGKGNIQLTGSLGDVMKESAMAGVSYIRSNLDDLGIGPDFNEKTDLHVHVPEGATPKDGPSAGITIATGIISTLTHRKVRQDFAMTGEVTIRGRVLPIGGLKEKALAANRYGIHNVIIPKANERDIKDIPETIRNSMTFYPVSNMDEVVKLVME